MPMYHCLLLCVMQRALASSWLRRIRHEVNIPGQSRGLYLRSRSKRLFGVANAAPVEVSRLKAAKEFMGAATTDARIDRCRAPEISVCADWIGFMPSFCVTARSKPSLFL